METTIAAISTAMSASGIGIIRISGENAMDVISRIYRSKGGKKKIKEVPTHTIHYGYIYDGEEPYQTWKKPGGSSRKTGLFYQGYLSESRIQQGDDRTYESETAVCAGEDGSGCRKP